MADYLTDYYYSVLGHQNNVATLYRMNNISMTMDLHKYTMLLVNVFYTDISYQYISESATLTWNLVLFKAFEF